MKTVRAHGFGGPEQLQLDEVADPQPGLGQVRIRVKAVGVNPVDWKLMSGKSPVPIDLPLTPGGDVAGTVDAVGEGVTDFAVGDDVFALLGLTGAYAEAVVTDAANVAPKPANLGFEEAASLPLVALTAWQGFVADDRDLSGLNILIHNGAGGVGMAAIQIAKARGAYVLASASLANADYVKSLGADEVVDFRVTPVSDTEQKYDIMLDLAGNPEAMELWSLVKTGGSVIRIAGGADAPKLADEGGLRVYKVRVRASGEQLAEIGKLVENGAIRTEVARKFALAEAADAQRLSQTGHVRGKIVLQVAT